jgi:hypothetical protein
MRLTGPPSAHSAATSLFQPGPVPLDQTTSHHCPGDHELDHFRFPTIIAAVSPKPESDRTMKLLPFCFPLPCPYRGETHIRGYGFDWYRFATRKFDRREGDIHKS